MTLDDLLLALLEAVSATGDQHLVGWGTVQHWPPDALERLLRSGILTPAVQAQSVECTGCENQCFVEVELHPGTESLPTRAFSLCIDPEMQPQMGRIVIPLEHLQQWRVTPLQLAKVTAKLLGIECKAKDQHGQADIRVGMIKGKKGRRWLTLNKSPLALELNDHHLPLDELLFFDGQTLAIDERRITAMVDRLASRTGKPYQPSVDKREARKRRTEAMYEDWRQEYRKLRGEYPDTVRHNDSWIARKIAGMEIAKGRDAETIRKKMKS